MCLGYYLGWEGGTYSVRKLVENICADKEEHCRRLGVYCPENTWNGGLLLARMVTDRGREYTAEEISQLAELGVTVEHLPAYRPELKGTVEKFFDVVQGYFKPYLKGRGVVESDFRERGVHDYRKDACLTLRQFETVLLCCIVHYNAKRVAADFPYTEEMESAGVKPNAASIWKYGCSLEAANVIAVKPGKLKLTLLPRTTGKFRRNGFIVNGMRYKNEGYVCIAMINRVVEFPQSQENAVFDYATAHQDDVFSALADSVELLDYPQMTLNSWKINHGKITLKGWFLVKLKLQNGTAEEFKTGVGRIEEADKGFDFEVTLNDDFSIAQDSENNTDRISIQLQGA